MRRESDERDGHDGGHGHGVGYGYDVGRGRATGSGRRMGATTSITADRRPGGRVEPVGEAG